MEDRRIPKMIDPRLERLLISLGDVARIVADSPVGSRRQTGKERVAQREGDRRAGRGRQGLGTRLLGDTRVEHDLRLTPEDRLWIPRDRDHGHAQPLELAHEPEQLIGGAALRQQDRHVVPVDDAQIAVQRVHWMEE